MHEVITYRLDLTEEEIKDIREIVKAHNGYISDDLMAKINSPKQIKYSGKKGYAAERATAARSRKAKEKIENAMRINAMQGIDPSGVSAYQLAKDAGVSYNTARKYLSTLNEVKD